MITNKTITKIIAVIMGVTVCLCLATVFFADELEEALGGPGVTMEYESKLFDTDEPITVNIVIDDAEWDDILTNAIDEEYHQCDVEINGETFYEVGIRTKGNTSLTTIASDPTTDRYSFKLEFDQYVNGQTCYGLDKLVLNNNYADATNMKEALIYDMYQYLGVDASLYNYAKIYVNGDYWGVYLALEAVEDSFMLRNYGTEDGALYKPDSMNIGGGMDGMGDMTPPSQGDAADFDPSQFSGTPPEDTAPSQTEDAADTADATGSAETDATADTGQGASDAVGASQATPPDMGDLDFSAAGFGGFSMGGSGADLNYTDDDLDSYSTIWDGEVTDTSKSDHRRVVTALKNISEGNDLETYMDVDNLLRYMVVHTFSVNEDSLSGVMAHNYYLYEFDGQLNILPWDYNLALGGMSGMGGGSGTDGATSVVNSAIDEAFAGTDFFDTLMADEGYHAQYYSYFSQLVDEYINGGGFDEFYERTRSQIDSLVETDPNAFYSYDEYVTAAETLYEVVQLRGRSIRGQLDGTIPSTESEQRDSNALIDASDIDLSVMGSMSMGNMDGGFDFGGAGTDAAAGTSDTETAAGSDEAASQDETAALAATGGFTVQKLTASTENSESGRADSAQPAGGDLPEGFDPSQFDSENMPEGFDPSQFSGTAPGDAASAASDTDSGTTAESSDSTNGDTSSASADSTMPEMPAGFSSSEMPDMSGSGTASTTMISNLITYGICIFVLLLALLFAKLFRRRPRRR